MNNKQFFSEKKILHTANGFKKELLNSKFGEIITDNYNYKFTV